MDRSFERARIADGWKTGLVRDDLARAVGQLRHVKARGPHDQTAERQLDAALAILERAQRTVDTSAEPAPDRVSTPVRIEPLVGQVVLSHDPDGKRVSCDAASVVVNLDAVRFERTVDLLVGAALGAAVPGTVVAVQVKPVAGGVMLRVALDGRDILSPLERAVSRRASSEPGDEEGMWGILATLIEDQGARVETLTASPACSSLSHANVVPAATKRIAATEPAVSALTEGVDHV